MGARDKRVRRIGQAEGKHTRAPPRLVCPRRFFFSSFLLELPTRSVGRSDGLQNALCDDGGVRMIVFASLLALRSFSPFINGWVDQKGVFLIVSRVYSLPDRCTYEQQVSEGGAGL